MKKVKVYSIHSNRPDFIEWQAKSFQKWMKTPFELIIVNNADAPEQRQAIDTEATKQSLQVINTRSTRDLPGFKHADALKQTWTHVIKDRENFAMFVDGDVFMIGAFDVEEYLAGAAMAGSKQQRDLKWHWLTPVVMVFDMEKIPEPETIDWEGGAAPDGTRMDVAGNLFYYLEAHPEIKQNVKWMYHTWHIKSENNNRHVLPDNMQHYQDHWNLEIFGDVFLHYCRSSNWDGQTKEHHKAKTDFVFGFVNGTIDGTVQAKRLNYMIPNETYFGWGKWL